LKSNTKTDYNCSGGLLVICDLVLRQADRRLMVSFCWGKYRYWVMSVFRVPDVTIATDVICGFPTETAEVSVLCLLCYVVMLLVSCMHSEA